MLNDGLFGVSVMSQRKRRFTRQRGKATKTEIGPVYHGNLKFNFQMNNHPQYNNLDLLYHK